MSHRFVSTLLLLLALVGCAPAPDQAPTATPPDAASDKVVAADEHAAGPASPGKPGAPVTISFEPAQAPVLGQALQVLLTISPTSAVEHLEVQLAASEGLSLARHADLPSGARAAGEAWTGSLTVTPTSAGSHQLSATVITGLGEARRASVRVLPLQVGPQAKNADTVTVTPEGERLIETPAQESGG